MDGSNPFFGDVRVRRALAHAYDMDRVIRDVTYGVYQPSPGIFGPGSFGYDASVERLAFDLDRARALLDEAGWLPDAEDGWRYREIDGERVKFSFVATADLRRRRQDGRHLSRGPAPDRRPDDDGSA
jgi:peptide/nickel transport system substrate-binding protein